MPTPLRILAILLATGALIAWALIWATPARMPSAQAPSSSEREVREREAEQKRIVAQEEFLRREEAARAERMRMEMSRKQAEMDRRAAEEARAKFEADRREAEAKAKADEDAHRAAAKTRADEDARRAAEAKRMRDGEARSAVEAKVRADEEARRAALTRAQAEEDARRAKQDADSKAAAAAASASAAAAAEAETERKAAAARAAEQARRVAGAAAAKAQADRQAADAARLAQAKLEADRLTAEAAKKAAEAATETSACEAQNQCTAVRIFFGTDRKHVTGSRRIELTAQRADQLSLGRAIVTVPRSVNRKLGEILTPTFVERVFFRVPAEGDKAKHFTIPQNGIRIYRSIDDFLTAANDHMRAAGEFKEHAFIFVHGYNTSFDGALYRSAQLAYDLGNGEPFGTAFLYSWPSGARIQDYTYDLDSARLSVEHLKSFVSLVIEQTNAKFVHLIAHSMGNWPLLTALSQLKVSTSARAKINEIILASPDIDANEFRKLAAQIVPIARGVTLYAGSRDQALRASRAVRRDTSRAGDASTAPMIMPGLDTIDVTDLNSDVLSLAHSEYAERSHLLNDIALILRRGERPPNARTPILRKYEYGGSSYWKFPP